MEPTKTTYRWGCLDCLACHVAFEDPTHFNATGREHIATHGHSIEASKTVDGKVVGHGVWAPPVVQVTGF